MGINFKTAAMPDGKSTYEMLAFLVAKRGDNLLTDAAFRDLVDVEYDAYDLTQDGDQHVIWTLETEYDSFESFCQACIRLLWRTHEYSGIVRCSLMFDGSYDGDVSTINSEFAASIYGLTTKTFGPVLCTDIAVLRSESWRNLIQLAGC